MAQSASHQLGELIGNFFEDTFKTPMKQLVRKNKLFLDTIGPRGTRKGTKITWEDVNGSKHDLDYVVEKGGSNKKIGNPVAFIELAWRRYTKHSKNKAQEIAGAVNPIAEKYKHLCPFKGAMLAGEFTQNSLDQLRNDGFSVFYVPMAKVVECFADFGIDISYDEDTPENEAEAKVEAFNSIRNLAQIGRHLIEMCKDELDQFFSEFEIFVNRSIDYVCIFPLHGIPTNLANIDSAIKFVETYDETSAQSAFAFYQICICYTNGSKIEARFNTKKEVLSFLRRNC